VHQLPIITAYADQLGLVGLINHSVPPELDGDAGTVVRGLVLDTLSGRSPLYRLEEFFAHQDTELLLGKALPPHACTDDTVGRVLDRLYDFGTRRLLTACAVRAAARFGLERRSVHFDTTSRSVWGDYEFAEEQDVPVRVTYGYSKDKRPDLTPFVLSTLCVDRAVPMWGKPEDGNASDKTLNPTLLAEIAQLLARHGVQRGAYISMADAALVTEENLAALRDTLFITRLPATYSEGGRGIAEAVAHNRWEEVGVLAQTKPTKHRPAASYKVAERVVTLYGKSYRAVVVHSSTQDPRRQQHLARELQASSATLEVAVRPAAKQEYFCRADAAAAAQKLRALPSAYHQREVVVEERPRYGPGRPSRQHPRPVKAMRYGLKPTLRDRSAVIARPRQEAACFVLLTNVPTTGEMAHRAGEVLRAYKEQHGVEQHLWLHPLCQLWRRHCNHPAYIRGHAADAVHISPTLCLPIDKATLAPLIFGVFLYHFSAQQRFFDLQWVDAPEGRPFYRQEQPPTERPAGRQAGEEEPCRGLGCRNCLLQNRQAGFQGCDVLLGVRFGLQCLDGSQLCIRHGPVPASSPR
jgi:transposase